MLRLLSRYRVVSGCSLPGGEAAASASACPQGKLETIFVDAVAVMVPYYKPVSVISLLLTDEIKQESPSTESEQDWDVDGQILAKPAHVRGMSHHGAGAPAWGSWTGRDAAVGALAPLVLSHGVRPAWALPAAPVPRGHRAWLSSTLGCGCCCSWGPCPP